MRIPTVQHRANYKSYRAVWLKNGISSCGAPSALMIRVDKNGTAKISVQSNWFSESRGIGGAGGAVVVLEDSELRLLAKRCLDDQTAVAGLIDRVIDLGLDVRGDLAGWLRYLSSDQPEALLWAERRAEAEAKRPEIGVGELAWFFDHPDFIYRVLGLHFDWVDGLGGPGWRVLLRGLSCLAYRAHKPRPDQLGLPVVE